MYKVIRLSFGNGILCLQLFVKNDEFLEDGIDSLLLAIEHIHPKFIRFPCWCIRFLLAFLLLLRRSFYGRRRFLQLWTRLRFGHWLGFDHGL